MVASSGAPGDKVSAVIPPAARKADFLRRLPRWLPLVCLWAATILLFGLTFYRLSPLRWNVPPGYSTDSLNELATIRAASQGHYLPMLWKNVPQLGAPGVANWNDMPITEDFLYAFLGALARVVGLMPAANFGLLLAFLLSGTTFYCTCRLLHYRTIWSLTGALLYSFSHYAFYRSFPHLELTYYAHLPLALLVTWWLGSGKLRRLTDRHAWLALGVAAWSGLQNAYYANVIGQFMVFALLANLVRRRDDPGRQRAAGFCALALVVLVSGFLVGNIDTFSYGWVHGKNPWAMERNYAGTEIYALKPMELFLPGPLHRFKPLREEAKFYFEMSSVLRVERGEIFSPYLGLIGILGLIWLGAVGFVRASRRAAAAKLPAGTWQIVWIAVFSAIGGINCLLALWGLELFRATNRYSIFILTIALIFLVRMLSAHTRRWPILAQAALAALVFGVGLYDQNFIFSPISSFGPIEAKVESDRVFTAALEKELPAQAAVFQLPVALYPEQASIAQMTDYEHFRPYLYAKTLRFSYGDTKGRGREQWQVDLEKHLRRAIPQGAAMTTEVLAALRNKGFSALIIDRNGYPDKGAAMIEVFRQAGQPVIADAKTGEFIAFRLTNPAPLAAHAD
jgi:hypothetical protein